MLRVGSVNGRECPVIICDNCSKPIEDMHDGLYEWQADSETGDPISGEIFLVHRQCCFSLKKSHDEGIVWYVGELVTFLCLLAQLTGG